MPAAEPEVSRLAPKEAALARVGTLLAGKWRLDGLLGRGGMATVYAATNKTTRAKVAVKILAQDLATDPVVCERFVREAQIANSIQHPARVAVVDDGRSEEGEVFLVMELLHGQTLDQLARDKEKPRSLEENLAVFIPVLELLGECHAAGIVHRDIKPANIFVTQEGQVKVFDFGVARLREAHAGAEYTKQGTVLGTPAFMAPEQALGLADQVDGRADIWSVGACLYTLITGKRVHQARSENESMVLAATAAAESIAVIAPDLPVEVVALVDKALAHDREQRFSDAKAMVGALATLLAALRTGQVTSAKRGQGDVVVVRRGGAVATEDEEANSPEGRARTSEALKSIWKQLTQCIAVRRHYGVSHAMAMQPMAGALDEISHVLTARPDSLTWTVSPYAFVYDKTPLWPDDKAALVRMSFTLFSAGLRQMQFKPGLTLEELGRFLSVISRDPKSGLLLTDDPIADLWSQRFQHVAHAAVDSFVSGSAEEIESFEGEADDVARDALKISMVTKGIDQTESAGSLEARAIRANLLAGLTAATEVASSLSIDAGTRLALGAQVGLLTNRRSERFVEATAAALVEAEYLGDEALVTKALGKWSDATIGRGEQDTAFERFGAISKAVAAFAPAPMAESIDKKLSLAMFDRAKLEAIVKQNVVRGTAAAGGKPNGPVGNWTIRGMKRALELLGDDPFFTTAVNHWLADVYGDFSSVLFGYVKRWAAPHAPALAAIIEKSPTLPATRLLEVFREIPSAEADVAIGGGLRNPELEVKRAALAMVKGDAVAADLSALLGHSDKEFRCQLLAAISKLRMRSLGPTIVRRIQLSSFKSMDTSEKKAWLSCLFALNAKRAAEIALEMLQHAPVVPSEANDLNRIVALDVLAKAEAREALPSVQAAAKKIWWNTPPVREAANAAIAALNRPPASPDGTEKSP